MIDAILSFVYSKRKIHLDKKKLKRKRKKKLLRNENLGTGSDQPAKRVRPSIDKINKTAPCCVIEKLFDFSSTGDPAETTFYFVWNVTNARDSEKRGAGRSIKS